MSWKMISTNDDEDLNFDGYIEDIENTQQYVPMLLNNMNKFTSKLGKLRDAGDEMAKALNDMTLNDNSLGEVFSNNIKQYSSCLSAIEDHRDSLIERINSKMMENLRIFNDGLKNVKIDLKKSGDSYFKEINKSKKLVKTSHRHTSIDRHIIKTKELNKENPIKEARKIKKNLVDYMKSFENDKNKVIDEFLKEFALIQLSFHSQAIQIYTASYQSLLMKSSDYNVDEDLHLIGKDLYSKPGKLDSKSQNTSISDNTNCDPIVPLTPVTPLASMAPRTSLTRSSSVNDIKSESLLKKQSEDEKKARFSPSSTPLVNLNQNVINEINNNLLFKKLKREFVDENSVSNNIGKCKVNRANSNDKFNLTDGRQSRSQQTSSNVTQKETKHNSSSISRLLKAETQI